MAKANLTPVPSPRFTEAEYGEAFEKCAQIFASIEALWQAAANESDDRMRGRHLDTIQTLAQTGGFIADHLGQDGCGYGDVYTWLGIAKGAGHE